jgi:NAD+ kinase
VIALNEFTLRNASQIHAIRFEIEVNRKKINGILIGDGVIVSTPFGSTGYFYSIAKKSFDKGIGIAFNNLTKHIRPIILNEDARVKIKLMRGTALLSHDNDPHMVRLHEGDTLEVRKAKEVARIIRIR